MVWCILLCCLALFKWVFLRSAAISLMGRVSDHLGVTTLLVLHVGSLPAREAVCVGRAGGSPCWAGAHQMLQLRWLSCCVFILTVISHADLYGSNQATSVVSLLTFKTVKTQSRKKCKTHFVTPGFLQAGLFRGLHLKDLKLFCKKMVISLVLR